MFNSRFIDVRRAGAAGLVLGLAAGAGGQVFDLKTDGSRTGADFTLSAVSPFKGSLKGNYDAASRPDGTRTCTSLFGSCPNEPIPMSGSAELEGGASTVPTAVFTLDVNLGAMIVTMTGFNADLLGGAQPAIGSSVTAEWDGFRTQQPDSLFPGGFPVELPLGDATLKVLTAVQNTGAAEGELESDGAGGYTFLVVPTLDITAEAEAIGTATGPQTITLPFAISGTLKITGGTAEVLAELDFETDQTLPGPFQGPADVPVDVPTVFPTGSIAHLLVNVTADSVTLGVAVASDFYATGEAKETCRPDCNKDGVLNVNDFICFQAEWRRQSDYGDYNGDGKWNVNDFIAFQASWRKGC